MSVIGTGEGRGIGERRTARRWASERSASLVWLVAALLVVAQVLSAIQISSLRERVVQIEAGVEFWEYGQNSCSAPAGGGRSPATGGLVAFRADGTI